MAAMSIYLLGEREGGAPFDRVFFKSLFDDILKRAGKERTTRLTLYLSDGSTMDVCHIEEFADRFLVLRAYRGTEDDCELAVHVLPYGLIYRLELGPKDEQTNRVGFQWSFPRKEKGPRGRDRGTKGANSVEPPQGS